MPDFSYRAYCCFGLGAWCFGFEVLLKKITCQLFIAYFYLRSKRMSTDIHKKSCKSRISRGYGRAIN
jgi:hypothetical protein